MSEKEIIGYQLVDCEGYIHHEFMGDSFNLKNRDVVRGQALEFIKRWMKINPYYTLKPIYKDQYPLPRFIDRI